MKRIRSRLFQIAGIAVILTLAAPVAVNAQKRKPIPSSDRPPAPESSPGANLRTGEQASLEMGMLMSRRTLVADLERQRARAAAQTAEDLELLEQLNSSKLIPQLAATPLDYKNLAITAAEIKFRATRIKFYSPLILIDKSGEKVR
jgi:hypothetical protein